MHPTDFVYDHVLRVLLELITRNKMQKLMVLDDYFNTFANSIGGGGLWS